MDFESSRLWAVIGQQLDQLTGLTASVELLGNVCGGDINQAVRISHNQVDYFVKLNHSRRLSMFEAEAAGLNEIALSGSLRCPKAVALGSEGNAAFLVLEYLRLEGAGNSAALGNGLAQMHRSTSSRYGWHRDNTIGSTLQTNAWTGDWIKFWGEQRLGFQLELAGKNGYGAQLASSGEQLLGSLHYLFEGYEPAPSLLHGDLWGGNYGWLETGEPVIFDPAVYFGDRETDLAMTELFGGFDHEFYSAYRSSWPLDSGYPVRKHLYQLYHVLNHLNLFGSGYLARSENLIRRILAELG